MPLGSGSRGNCTYIGNGRRGILVDCGLSTRQILGRLDAAGIGDTRIDGVLITHEHTDHVGAARILDDRLFKTQGRRVPFYMTRGTRVGLNPRCLPRTPTSITAGSPFHIPGTPVDWRVEPYTIPHDTADPVAYTVCIGDLRVGVITDLGRSTRLVEQQFSALDVAVLEFNHDVDMLMEGDYPWRLKQRVRGAHGHLSNDQSAGLVGTAATSRLKHLVLAHLSQDNNRPEHAVEAAHSGLHQAGLKGVNVEVARQREALDPMALQAPLSAAPPQRRPRRSPRAAPVADDATRQVPLF